MCPSSVRAPTRIRLPLPLRRMQSSNLCFLTAQPLETNMPVCAKRFDVTSQHPHSQPYHLLPALPRHLLGCSRDVNSTPARLRVRVPKLTVENMRGFPELLQHLLRECRTYAEARVLMYALQAATGSRNAVIW